MSDAIYKAFLKQQREQGLALAGSSDILDLTPLPDGEFPDRYICHFDNCRGLVRNEHGEIVEFDKFRVGIWFPDDYLRHVIIPQVLTYLGPHPEPWHPNFSPPFICANLVPGTALVDIIYTVFELWTWNLVGTRDEGLHHAAAQWSRQQPRTRFPIDRRPLKRRGAQLELTPAKGRGAT